MWWPSDWQERPEYLRLRITRLQRALPFCRGRASDVRVIVEKEIECLQKKLNNLVSTKSS
jgi:hypothetical protein